jgi:hypothetical protein
VSYKQHPQKGRSNVWNSNKGGQANKVIARKKFQNYTNCTLDSSDDVNEWIVDSGATKHMTPNRKLFSELYHGNFSSVTVANGSTVEASGEGTINVSVTIG